MDLIKEVTAEDAFDIGVQEGKKLILRELLGFEMHETFMHKLMKAKLKELETKVTLDRTLRNEETESVSKT